VKNYTILAYNNAPFVICHNITFLKVLYTHLPYLTYELGRNIISHTNMTILRKNLCINAALFSGQVGSTEKVWYKADVYEGVIDG